jgi:putative ABC transport system permease protein
MGGTSRNLTVTGVAQDVPRTSSLYFDFLVSLETAHSLSEGFDDWNTNRHTAFLLAGQGFDAEAFEAKLPVFVDRYFSESPDSIKQLYVMLFRDFRLNSRHITSLLRSTHPASVIVTFAIGVLLLLVVSINFINLSTARYMHRIREIGMRKVIGASRRQLMLQFLGESLLLSFLALPVAILLYEMLHPAFYAYLGDLSIVAQTSAVSNSIWNYPFLLKYLVAAAVITGLFSGAHPAFVLSSYKPLSVLSGRFTGGKRKKRGSKALIIFQFSLAVLFIAAASIIQNQTGHFVRADLGYSRDHIAMVRLTPETLPMLGVLKAKLVGHSDVVRVTASAGLPVIWENLQPARLPDAAEEESVSMHAYGVDYGFPEAFDIKIRQGRSFSRTWGDRDSLILNAAAARKMGWDDPVGRQLVLGGRTGTVIGVAEDFLFADIGFGIPPSALFLEPDNLNFLLVKYSSSGDFQQLRTFMKTQWLSLNPDLPFECQTLDDIFNQFFRLLGKIAGFLKSIGITTVIFSCLGLLGLASYMVEQRTREIGIRKIMGASSPRILWRLMREYVVLVAVANVVSLGLLYFGWHKVLQTGLLFITDISAGTYATALLFSLATAALAVTSQTWKAVRANPADSLRYE